MASQSSYDTVVVGSGLAGLTTALRLSEKGFSVALVEKTASLGGNSIKASSGINGVPTRFQNNEDSVGSFIDDTTKSGKGLCDEELVGILAGESAAAIRWLTDDIGVDLSVVNRLGGHSFARTHRGSGKLPPGFAIVSALTKKIKESGKIDVLTNARLEGFLKDDLHVRGVSVERASDDGVRSENITADNVVLATGGFSADTTRKDSLIRQYRPDLVDFPSTNGQQTTGDGHRLVLSELDAKLVQMDQIQVHPTGFIQLKDAASKSSKWKFLCGELIRGIGGVLVSPTTGKRFTNELGTRDAVTDSIMKNCGNSHVAVIVVGAEDYKKAASHIDFYVSQSLMFKGGIGDVCTKLAEIDANAQCPVHDFESTIRSYNTDAKMQADSYGRTHFGGEIGSEFYFGFVTPVLHFTMGGVETNEERQIVTKQGETISNVYAVGELSAGVHGANRLGGSSLLECVVFGSRVAEHIGKKKKEV